MGKFFFFSVIISIISGIINGKTAEVSAAALEESSHAVELSIKLLGSLCFWSGIMETARQSGIIEKLRELKPAFASGFSKTQKRRKSSRRRFHERCGESSGAWKRGDPFRDFRHEGTSPHFRFFFRRNGGNGLFCSYEHRFAPASSHNRCRNSP